MAVASMKLGQPGDTQQGEPDPVNLLPGPVRGT